MSDSTMNETDGYAGWVLAAIGTVVSTLAGLVAMFYRTQIADYKNTERELKGKLDVLEKRADSCEADRENLRIKYAVLEQRVSDLEVNKANRDSIG